MAVTGAQIMAESDRFDGQVQGDAITRVYLVTTDGGADTEEDYQVIQSAIAQGLLPAKGHYYKTTAYQAISIRAEIRDPADRTMWLATVVYDNMPRDRKQDDDKPEDYNPDDPESDPLIVQIRAAVMTRDANVFDQGDNVVGQNINDQTFDPPPQIQYVNQILSITGNTLVPVSWQHLVGSVNSEDCTVTAVDPVTGTTTAVFIPAGCGQVSDFTSDGPNIRDLPEQTPGQSDRQAYWANTLELEIQRWYQDLSGFQLFYVKQQSDGGSGYDLAAEYIDPTTDKYFRPVADPSYDTGGKSRIPWFDMLVSEGTTIRQSTPAWGSGLNYTAGDAVEASSSIWSCIQDHTSDGNNVPGGTDGADYWIETGSPTGRPFTRTILKKDIGGFFSEEEALEPVDRPQLIRGDGSLWQRGQTKPIQVGISKRLEDWRGHFAT